MADKVLKELLDGRDGDKPFTHRALLAHLLKMTDAQLDQEVQVMPNNPTPEPTRLLPVYGIDTVENYCHVDGEVSTETRSAVDFEHHPEQFVLLADYSPFSKDGDSFFTMEEGGMRGNKTGKLIPGPFGTGEEDDESQDGPDDSLRRMSNGASNCS